MTTYASCDPDLERIVEEIARRHEQQQRFCVTATLPSVSYSASRGKPILHPVNTNPVVIHANPMHPVASSTKSEDRTAAALSIISSATSHLPSTTPSGGPLSHSAVASEAAACLSPLSPLYLQQRERYHAKMYDAMMEYVKDRERGEEGDCCSSSNIPSALTGGALQQQPVYGPSVEVRYAQFYDFSSNRASRVPWSLEETGRDRRDTAEAAAVENGPLSPQPSALQTNGADTPPSPTVPSPRSKHTDQHQQSLPARNAVVMAEEEPSAAFRTPAIVSSVECTPRLQTTKHYAQTLDSTLTSVHTTGISQSRPRVEEDSSCSVAYSQSRAPSHALTHTALGDTPFATSDVSVAAAPAKASDANRLNQKGPLGKALQQLMRSIQARSSGEDTADAACAQHHTAAASAKEKNCDSDTKARAEPSQKGTRPTRERKTKTTHSGKQQEPAESSVGNSPSAVPPLQYAQPSTRRSMNSNTVPSSSSGIHNGNAAVVTTSQRSSTAVTDESPPSARPVPPTNVQIVCITRPAPKHGTSYTPTPAPATHDKTHHNCKTNNHAQEQHVEEYHPPSPSRCLQESLFADAAEATMTTTAAVSTNNHKLHSQHGAGVRKNGPAESHPERTRQIMSLLAPHTTGTAASVMYTVQVEGHFDRIAEVRSAHCWATGAFVLFEGDRGTDAGRVLGCSLALEEGPSCHSNARQGGKRQPSIPLVLRAATPEEEREWTGEQLADAQQAVPVIQEAVKSLRLPLTIHGALYQFDREKLTVLYHTTEARVDFRQLLQTLFAKYRCRIWMERAPINVSS